MELIKQLLIFIGRNLVSLVLSFIMLLIGLFLLPEKLILKGLSYIKPSILSNIYDKYDNHLNIIINLILEGSYPNQNNLKIKDKLEQIKNEKDKLDSIENTIFTLDLLKDLSGSFNYVTQGGYDEETNNVIREMAEYFLAYTHRLDDKNMRLAISQEFNNLYNEMLYKKNIKNTLELKNKKIEFQSFLEDERRNSEEKLKSIKNKIKSLVMEIIKEQR